MDMIFVRIRVCNKNEYIYRASDVPGAPVGALCVVTLVMFPARLMMTVLSTVQKC